MSEAKTTKKKDVISQDQINEWKAEHGAIYKSVLCGGSLTVIWRRLKRQEYRDIMKDNIDIEDAENKEVKVDLDDKIYQRESDMAKKVILYPKDVDSIIEGSAGVASTLAEEILEKSGFDKPKTEEL